MSSIKIIQAPKFDAPQWVRDRFVGTEFSIIGEESMLPEKRAYVVSVDAVISRFKERGIPWVSKWLEDNLPQNQEKFAFPEQICEYLP